MSDTPQFVSHWQNGLPQFLPQWEPFSEGVTIAPANGLHVMAGTGGALSATTPPGFYGLPIAGFRWWKVQPRTNQSVLVG